MANNLDNVSGCKHTEVSIKMDVNESKTKNLQYDRCSLSNDQKDAGSSSILQITDLPAEIIQHVLRYLTFDNIAKLRLVSQYFNNMCSALLNSEFNRLRVAVQQRFLNIKAQMPRRESSRRKHPLARESDIIETLYMRLTLLNMTFGKHIERKYCCFFAGEILDEIYKILRYVENTPCLNRAYKVTDELFDLSTMAMEYFKDHIEPSLPEVTYFASEVFEYSSFNDRFRSSCILLGHTTETRHEPPLSKSAPVTTQLAVLEESGTHFSERSPKPPSSPIQVLNKRMKHVKDTVKRNSKDIANMKRSVKLVNQKINSLEEAVQQVKWQQKNSEGTTLPDSHKINDILVQLNVYKHEIELLSSNVLLSQSSNDKAGCETKNPKFGFATFSKASTNQVGNNPNCDIKPATTSFSMLSALKNKNNVGILLNSYGGSPTTSSCTKSSFVVENNSNINMKSNLLYNSHSPSTSQSSVLKNTTVTEINPAYSKSDYACYNSDRRFMKRDVLANSSSTSSIEKFHKRKLPVSNIISSEEDDMPKLKRNRLIAAFESSSSYVSDE